MKVGKKRTILIPSGENKGKTCYCRTIWMNAGERQPSPLDVAEMQDAMQAEHPNDLVSVQTRLSAFSGGVTVTETGDADEAPAV